MDERYPSQSSFAPGNTGAPGGYGAPGPYGASAAQGGHGAPGAYGQAAYDAAGYPAGGFGVPPYGVPGHPPGLPPGFPPALVPPGYNPWLGTFAGPRYASVWLRIEAYFIDGLVLGVVNFVAYMTIFVMTASPGETASPTGMLAAFVLVIVLDGIYFIAQ